LERIGDKVRGEENPKEEPPQRATAIEEPKREGENRPGKGGAPAR